MRRYKIALFAALLCGLVTVLTFTSANSTDAENVKVPGAFVGALADIGSKLPEPVEKYTVTADLYGKTETIEAEAGTSVAEVLDMMGAELESGDSVTPELTERIYSNTTITVTRTEYAFETEETEIPAAVRYVNSPYMDEGEEIVIKEGNSGRSEAVYKCTYINGELESRELESESELEAAGDTIISIGTRTSPSHDYTAPENYSVGSDGVVTTLNGTALTYTRTLNMRATAYTYNNYPGSRNITSSGQPVRVGLVAALPSTLPQGALVYIAAADGSWEYGIAEVADRPGMDIIDLFMDDYNECIEFGMRSCVVYVLDE